MEIENKRSVTDLLRGLISAGYDGTQQDLCDFLSKKGYQMNQSTVSRALKKIGAVKVHTRKGNRYELKQEQHSGGGPGFRGSLKELVKSTAANESMIVIRTRPGSAMFVAGFLDHYCKEFLLGTVAGDDTILVVPRSVAHILSCYNKIKAYLEIH